MGVYDQIKAAFQDLIAPEIRELRGEILRLDQKIDGVDARLSTKLDAVHEKIDGLDARLSTKIDGVRGEVASLRAELIAEIRRVDTRIDGLDRDVHIAIDIRERLAALEARQRS